MANALKLALVVTCAVALPGCGPGKRGGLPESIDGTYTITAMNYFGEIRLPDDVAKQMRPEARKIVFADGKMTTQMYGDPQTYDIVIDRTKTPSQVTFTRTDKDGKTETTYGVMAVVGGYLTVCRNVNYDLKPENRPTEITNGEKFLTLKLKKDA